ncbi:MAG: gluconokinase, partial [Mesorhizobium sp.]
MSMAASRLRSDPPPRMVVMGVTGSGKTTVGEALADAISATYVDGDKLHPQANIAKMSAGIPLDDADRWPWLAKVGATLRQRP